MVSLLHFYQLSPHLIFFPSVFWYSYFYSWMMFKMLVTFGEVNLVKHQWPDWFGYIRHIFNCLSKLSVIILVCSSFVVFLGISNFEMVYNRDGIPIIYELICIYFGRRTISSCIYLTKKCIHAFGVQQQCCLLLCVCSLVGARCCSTMRIPYLTSKYWYLKLDTLILGPFRCTLFSALVPLCFVLWKICRKIYVLTNQQHQSCMCSFPLFWPRFSFMLLWE